MPCLPYRWNGSSKFEFGGNHLGVIDLEGGTGQGTVEVGYSRAGWGFGHAYGVDDRQAWAWAGHSLGKSVFEIAVSSSTKLSAGEPGLAGRDQSHRAGQAALGLAEAFRRCLVRPLPGPDVQAL